MSRRNKRNFIDFGLLGKMVHAKRISMGFTQDMVADFCRCSVTHISRLENGSRIGLELLTKICVFLHLSLDDLMGITYFDRYLEREVLDLFLTHTFEERELAIYVMKSVFTVLDLMEKMRFGKSLADVVTEFGMDLSKLPPFELYQEQEGQYFDTEKTEDLMAAETPEPLSASTKYFFPKKGPKGTRKDSSEDKPAVEDDHSDEGKAIEEGEEEAFEEDEE
ncbi:MAG: helix-turn-helix transcriptional regulator [Firmicutes bacterium]|nr:helix-turn-helix transcriptional regulator [Bacillota bacterium]